MIIVDFLEHIETDRKFIQELFQIIKPGGELILNVPHVKNSTVRKFRLAMGQTDESLKSVLGNEFNLIFARTYSKFFSKSVDTLMTLGLGFLKGKEKNLRKE